MEVDEQAAMAVRESEVSQVVDLAAQIDSPDPACHALWNFSAGGYKPGGFISYLLLAIGMADRQNLLRLAVVYPAYVAAWSLGAFHTGGIEILRRVAEGETITADVARDCIARGHGG